jgi:phosphatidylglycerophosphatase A
MSATAVVMMLVAMAVIWGGLAFAMFNLYRSEKAIPSETRRDF